MKGSTPTQDWRERRETYWRSTPSIRDCQPSPVALKYANTSGLYRTDTSCFGFADLGRPRNARIGTIAFNCVGVRGRASGSTFAAATISLSSSLVGTTIEGRLDVLDIRIGH
jgi:hypothetical protein